MNNPFYKSSYKSSYDNDSDDDIIYDKNYRKGTLYSSTSKPSPSTLRLSARNKLEPQQPRTPSVGKDFIAGLGAKTKLPSKSEYQDDNEKSTWNKSCFSASKPLGSISKKNYSDDKDDSKSPYGSKTASSDDEDDDLYSKASLNRLTTPLTSVGRSPLDKVI